MTPFTSPRRETLLLLILGTMAFLLSRHAQLPNWVEYIAMLATLLACRQLASEWFTDRVFTVCWVVLLALVGLGLNFEVWGGMLG